LKEFLEDKGINVTEIECMTYHPEARTNTFRVAIAIGDYEKALNPEVWPYRVAVRTFRPSKRIENRSQWNFSLEGLVESSITSGALISSNSSNNSINRKTSHLSNRKKLLKLLIDMICWQIWILLIIKRRP
jgi:hypothetical protein